MSDETANQFLYCYQPKMPSGSCLCGKIAFEYTGKHFTVLSPWRFCAETMFHNMGWEHVATARLTTCLSIVPC